MLTPSLHSFIAQVGKLDLPSESYPYCYKALGDELEHLVFTRG